jgi:ankyrin repeat protein
MKRRANHMTGFLTAVAKNDLDAIRRLLQEGEDPNVKDADGRTALMHAAIGGNAELIAVLLQNGADPDAQDGNGFAAIHFAAQDFRLDAAEALLQAGANVDVRDKYGNTSLWRAVFNSRGRGEMIRLLLKHGASPSVKNLSGRSPMDLAQTIANYDVKQFLSP